jgi:hypothetical protein
MVGTLQNHTIGLVCHKIGVAMHWDEEKLGLNISQAGTDDLLDRVTAYRAGMEPDAVALVEQELQKRGVTAAKVAEHRESIERECVFHADGTAKMCTFCRKPAVRETWGWHKIMGAIPIFPRLICYCKYHAS